MESQPSSFLSVSFLEDLFGYILALLVIEASKGALI